MKQFACLYSYAPALVAALFAYLFTSPLAITDEWHFIEGVIRLESAATWTEWLRGYITDHHGHNVTVSFAVYLLIETLASYDSRALIALTIASYLAQVVVIRRVGNLPIVAILPISILYFSPSHYFDFLWGFMFALALATFFAVMALALLERQFRTQASMAATMFPTLMLLQFAVMSHANGLFGYAAAAVLVLFKRETPLGRRLPMIVAFVLIGFGNYYLLLRTNLPFRFDALLGILTGFGATVLDSPWAIRSFSFDTLTVLGTFLIVGGFFAMAAAYRFRLLSLVSFELSLFAYSLLAFASVMVIRGEFGNWQLQLCVPGIAGVFAALYTLHRAKALPAVAPFSYALALFASLYGYWAGFTNRGPNWFGMASGTEHYIRTFEAQPTQPKPFPGPYFVHQGLVDFFRRKGRI